MHVSARRGLLRIAALAEAVGRWQPRQVQAAAIDVARLVLDLELRHRDPADVDRDRFALWLGQLDLDRGDQPAILGDVTTLEWIRDRFAHTLPRDQAAALDAALGALRRAADASDSRALRERGRDVADLVAS